MANYNCPGQIVISGPTATLERVARQLEKAGAKRVVILKVSGAFHSRYMTAAAERFREFLDDVQLHEPQIPVLANCNAEPYTAANAAANLAAQINSSVQWIDTITYFKALPDPDFTEVGPGKVLTGMLRRFR